MPLEMPDPPNLAMELLCMLSPRPMWLDDLADDLGVEDERKVLALALALRRGGYAVEVGDITGMAQFHGSKRKSTEAVWVSLLGWKLVQRSAQAWWDQTRSEEVLHDGRAVG